MNKNELRLGNKVYQHEVADRPLDGKLIEKTIDNGTDIDNGFWWSPIPLTEEWVLKFGFLENDQTVTLKFTGSIFSKNCNGIMVFIVLCADNENLMLLNDGGGSQILPVRIAHVHQLQNVCFSLSEKELELQEKEAANA